MKLFATALVIALDAFFLVKRVSASLNCTLVAAPATERYCEWDDCQPFATRTVGEVLHATCIANCSDFSDPWFKLYNGAFIRTNNLKNCVYFGVPWPVTGLPHCWEDPLYYPTPTTLPPPTNCPASSSSGINYQIPVPTWVGPEDAPIPELLSGWPGWNNASYGIEDPNNIWLATTTTDMVITASATPSEVTAATETGTAPVATYTGEAGRTLPEKILMSVVGMAVLVMSLL